MSLAPIIIDDLIAIPKCVSRAQCESNIYIIFDDSKPTLKIMAKPEQQIIHITDEMKYLVHVHRTSRKNIYVEVYSLIEKKPIVAVDSKEDIRTIVEKLKSVPQYIREHIFRLLGFEVW